MPLEKGLSQCHLHNAGADDNTGPVLAYSAGSGNRTGPD